MRNRLGVVLMIALSVLAPALAFSPTSAHFTLGDNTPGGRFHANTFDPHVAGPLAYVWPGSGFASFTGAPAGFPPGYQDPYPGGNPPGQTSNVYQLESNSYAPFGAILTSTDDHASTGPLIFGLNFSSPCVFGWKDIDGNCGVRAPANGFCGLGVSYCANYTGLTIYLPPEFDLTTIETNAGLVQSTFGSTANDLTVTRADKWDPWGPGWWIVHVDGDIHWWPQHDYREWYYVRINSVIAPKIAGKYFFKLFLWDEFHNFVWPGMPRDLNINGWQCSPAPGICVNGPSPDSPFRIPVSGATNATFPAENWPVVLVKGEADPGVILGTIRYGTYNTALSQKPVDLPGRVRAVGLALDPYTGNPTGRKVEAQAYFNASAQGHFEIEGVAPGVYDIYASAAGYPEQLIGSNVTILKGQSLHLDGSVMPGAVVHGQIFSKGTSGDQTWPDALRPVFVEIYSNQDYSEDSVVAFSPLNLTHPPFMAYEWDELQSLPTPRPVAFPWFAPFATWGGTYSSQAFPSPPTSPNYDSHAPVTCGGVIDSCSKPNGVGAAQYWWVDGGGVFTNGGGSNSFIFGFGNKGVFGAPTEIDGHVPQTYATWISGLAPGRYWVRAWVNGYTQTLQDGVTLADYSFDVSPNEWAGDIFTPMDLHVGGTITVDVHFSDQPNTQQECPINGCSGNSAMGLSAGPRFLIVEVRNVNGSLAGMNFVRVLDPNATTTETVEINGIGMMGPDAVGVKYSYLRYSGYRDYGLPYGTYTVYLYARGYLEQSLISATLTSSSDQARISAYMFRGGRLSVTAASTDWEHPDNVIPWEFPGARFRVYAFNGQGGSVGYVGFPATIHAIGPPHRGDDPRSQPSCLVVSTTPPFCPTGIPQTITPTDTAGSTYVISEWDGFIAADDRGPDEVPWMGFFFGGNLLPYWYSAGFLYMASWYRSDAPDGFKARNALPADAYKVYGFTYGYIQHGEFSAFVNNGGFGDIQLKLLLGVNITLSIPFERQGDPTSTAFNMSMRVRVFDDSGRLVATAATKGPDNACINPFCSNTITSSGTGTTFGLGRFTGSDRNPTATDLPDVLFDSRSTIGPFVHSGRGSPDSGTYYVDPVAKSPGDQNGFLSLDSSTADTFLWHGTWNVGPGGSSVVGWQAFDSDPDHDGISDFGTFQFNQNGWGLFKWRTWIPAGTDQVQLYIGGIYDPFGDPLDNFNAGILHTRAWDGSGGEQIDSMYYGIDGFSSTIPNSYSGQWTIEVDTWNEYSAHVTPTTGAQAPPQSNWYPAVQGLLEGESFHFTLGGYPAPSGYTGDRLITNGLGPYGQLSNWTIPNARLGTEISASFELDRRGYISGEVQGFTWSDELRTESWMSIQAVPTSGNTTFTQWTTDGFYDMYVPGGDYDIKIIAWPPDGSAFTPANISIHVREGLPLVGLDVKLEESKQAIPEFSIPAFAVFPALLLSLILARRKLRRT